MDLYSTQKTKWIYVREKATFVNLYAYDIAWQFQPNMIGFMDNPLTWIQNQAEASHRGKVHRDTGCFKTMMQTLDLSKIKGPDMDNKTF